MKNLLSLIALSVLLGSCGQKQAVKHAQERANATIDSMNAVNDLNTANLQRQKSIDSMNLIVEAEKQRRRNASYSENNSASGSANANPQDKKKMNNKTKGTLIGAGTGAVLGAVTGVMVDGKKAEGAVVGGLIGAGAGAGAVIGNNKDKKKAAQTSTVK